MSDAPSDERRSERHKVFVYLQVTNLSDKSPFARLGDISQSGIMLLTERILPLETRYRISIQLPPGAGLLHGDLELEVETRWSRPDANPGVICSGCVVTGLPPGSAEVVDWLAGYYSFNGGKRRFDQFKAQQQEDDTPIAGG